MHLVTHFEQRPFDILVMRAGTDPQLERAPRIPRIHVNKEGVRLAAELNPDVIVMDISMPIMNGIDATREIRENDPAASILILTGGTNVAEIDNARTAGAGGYLTKDRIANDLVDEIRGLAER